MWEVELSDRATDVYLAADDKISRGIERAIDKLVEASMPRGAKKLKGHRDEYRLRVGSLRILYTVYNREKRIRVTDIEKRGQAGLY